MSGAIAQCKYDKRNTTRISLKLNYKTDSDILTWLDGVVESEHISKQGAIKEAIRAYMKKEDKNHGN